MGSRIKQAAVLSAAGLIVVLGLAACNKSTSTSDPSPTPTTSEDIMDKDESMTREETMESGDSMTKDESSQ